MLYTNDREMSFNSRISRHQTSLNRTSSLVMIKFSRKAVDFWAPTYNSNYPPSLIQKAPSVTMKNQQWRFINIAITTLPIASVQLERQATGPSRNENRLRLWTNKNQTKSSANKASDDCPKRKDDWQADLIPNFQNMWTAKCFLN